MSEATNMVAAIQRGEKKASDELLPLVYTELRRLATYKMAHLQPGHTLQPTALVHEAYLRLVGEPEQKWNGRGHFFAAAAEAMRRILIENARRKAAVRHGGGKRAIALDEVEIAAELKEDEMLTINESLEKLARLDPEKAELVKLRYFAGMTLREAADVLNISERSAKRYWAYARVWLLRDINRQQPA